MQISPLQALETSYQELRYFSDQISVTRSRNATMNIHGVSLSELTKRYQETKSRIKPRLNSVSRSRLGNEDRRALAAIEKAWKDNFASEKDFQGEATTLGTPDCAYDPGELVRQASSLDLLTKRMYACFGKASEEVVFEGRILDRLTAMDLLSHTEGAERRRELFLSLGKIWNSVNGDNDQRSPYRHVVQLRVKDWQTKPSPFLVQARELGVSLTTVEEWLRQVLKKWQAVTPHQTMEPWDFFYTTGKANRVLDSTVPRSALEYLNRRYYLSLGAAFEKLGIHFDLEPRTGKDPVAYTTFAARNRLEHGRWLQGEFWVFASYHTGGLDNLSELLHETGHGIHLAAIRTRPAFEDWPDSDSFTEALADMTGLEIFEPAWQKQYLSISVPLADSLAAKYSGIVLDMAWALFEIEMHRNPTNDPNQVWTEITRDYLRIKPHPELSWWAIRGQLINAPGYMLNYGVGALITAELRAKVQELHSGKSFTEGDPSWYPWLAEHIYRFGLERSWRQVFESFVGRTLSSRSLLDDMDRMAPSH